MNKITIIGCGAFGHALALLLGRTHPELQVFAYDVDSATIKALEKERKHPYFHKEVIAPENIIPTQDLAAALAGAELVILAVPAQLMRQACESIKEHLPPTAILLNIAKALEDGSSMRMSEVIRAVLPGDRVIATLSGGMIAADAVHGAPVGAEIGCTEKDALDKLQALFLPTSVHVETTTDIIGVEFGGAFKNVIAIGAGVIDGLGWGASSKAFFVARALYEIEELAVVLGAQADTFHTASNFWMGDLMTTCFGSSRNRYFGELIGKGKTKEEAVALLKKERKHAEGLVTLKDVKFLLEDNKVTAPFLTTLYQVVYEGAAPEPLFLELSRLQDTAYQPS